MGSGSSKKSPPPTKNTSSPKPNPVANVNKEENKQERGREQIDIQTSSRDAEKKKKEEDEYYKKQEREKEKERIKKMKMMEEMEKEKSKKMKMEEKPKENMLTFEDDSDLDNDIDEVLKMPMAIEYPKPKKKDKKEKKDKGKKTEELNYDNKLDRDLFNSNSNGYSRNEDLPETYAQRLQRKQYKLQQDLLIRQKTMHRNANEWNDFDDEEDENLKNQGFDASKFRAANQGGDTKKDLFQTSSGNNDLETPRYLQSDQDNMDDFQVGRRPASPNRTLPSYNQSEIDLMHELERDLL